MAGKCSVQWQESAATGVYNADEVRASRTKYSSPSFVIVSLSLGIFYAKVYSDIQKKIFVITCFISGNAPLYCLRRSCIVLLRNFALFLASVLA